MKLEDTFGKIIKEWVWGYVCKSCNGGGADDEQGECQACKGSGIDKWQTEDAVKKLLEAVRVRDKEVLGEDKKQTDDFLENVYNGVRQTERAIIRKRMNNTL